ncbi:cytochrome c oxidase assembly protein [Deinococcus humi]|nr:cytochrome c oxidase assembly protein [Deinococcus humi]
MAGRQLRQGRVWRWSRTCFFTLGLALLAWVFSPAVNSLAHADLQAHMLQHLMSGMFAPLLLALGWPLTLLLRNVPVLMARRLIRWLHAPPLSLIALPVSALLLNVGGLYLLYLTQLYRLTLEHPAIHAVVAFHVVSAGLLYTVVLAGIEPVSTRTSFRTRVVVLLLGSAGHATLAKVLYAGHGALGTAGTVPQLQPAAQLMYYGGDLAELLLFVVVFQGWFRQREQARQRTQQIVLP